jgi:energy-coupling factor transport system ATP-binding protein
MVELKHVCYTYQKGTPDTLKDINIRIGRGEFVALAGQNGAGKTTLLKLLNGISKPTCGTVTVNGVSTKDVPVSRMAASVGFLFQNADHQIFSQTVREELAFGLNNIGVEKAEAERRVEETAARLNLTAKLDKNPFHLSRGERQRVALASVLALQTPVLVLDEPTTGQDYRECIEIMEIVRQQNESGTTVIMVSHDMELVSDYAKRVILLCEGSVLEDGAVREVMAKADALQKAGLMPTQIVALAQLLEESGENGFGGVYDVSTMLDAVKRRAGL